MRTKGTIGFGLASHWSRKRIVKQKQNQNKREITLTKPLRQPMTVTSAEAKEMIRKMFEG